MKNLTFEFKDFGAGTDYTFNIYGQEVNIVLDVFLGGEKIFENLQLQTVWGGYETDWEDAEQLLDLCEIYGVDPVYDEDGELDESETFRAICEDEDYMRAELDEYYNYCLEGFIDELPTDLDEFMTYIQDAENLREIGCRGAMCTYGEIMNSAVPVCGLLPNYVSDLVDYFYDCFGEDEDVEETA